MISTSRFALIVLLGGITAGTAQAQPAQPTPPSYSAPSGFTARAEAAFQSPDKGAFWVSAGEDGKFETHDDNLYSFEGN